MDKLSFKAFCIEAYAWHIGRQGSAVYALFATEGVLERLDQDYEDLHRMSADYLVHELDEYLGKTCSGDTEKRMLESGMFPQGHWLARSLAVPEIVSLIMARYGLEASAALDAFYRSVTGEAYCDDETGLYGQSPLFVCSLFSAERGELNIED